MKLDAIDDVYAQQIAALRSIVAQLRHALPALEEAAADQKLTRALAEHAGRLERQAERLDEVRGSSTTGIPDEPNEPVAAMLAEAEAIVAADGSDEVRDVALVAALQRIAHFEIACYGTARALADQLGLRDAVELLGETLAEEAGFDELLTKLATGGLIVSGLNERAQG